jgi:pimeloyl-ACP methyl ester carboxylesterase
LPFCCAAQSQAQIELQELPVQPLSTRLARIPRPGYLAAGAAAGLALAAAAGWVHQRARRAERDNPPAGRFVSVEGVRLHVVERGSGEPLVLLHGNGSMIQDFGASGLLDAAAEHHRVIAVDRPGYGYSERPRDRVWSPAEQARVIHAALLRLGVSRAIVLGHSWGTSVAVALALAHPGMVRGLVLVSGYYYPSARADVALLSAPAIPVIGDLMRHTVSPLLARLAWPGILRKLFGPAPVPAKFAAFPVDMALRPGPLRASAAEAALMIPDAAALQDRYRELTMPVAVLAGDGDRLVTTADQSARLHDELPDSTFQALPGVGHMAHHTATDAVLAAIAEVDARSAPPAPGRRRAAAIAS